MTAPQASRRDVMKIAAAGIAAAGIAAAGVATLGGWTFAKPPVRHQKLQPQALQALHIPALAPSVVEPDGTRVFQLVAQQGETEFFSGKVTPTWGYNAAFGGPTLRASTGETVRINVKNELDEVTTSHWHGAKLPAKADGGPHQPIHPGNSWTAEWQIEQAAATMWYHPHNHGTTEPHVYRGLAGMFIIDDAPYEGDTNPVARVLPGEYGVDDIPIIITDRNFTADGSFDEKSRGATGMLGDTILVNGTVSPRFEATRAETRLRILNGSTARSYHLRAGDSDMLLVATDTGLLPEPVTVTGVTLTPGERVEVVVTLVPGQDLMLTSEPHSLGLLTGAARASGSQDRFDILEVHRPANSASAPHTSIIDRLAAVGGTLGAVLPTPFEPDKTRSIILQNNKINYFPMDMNRIDQVVTLGDRERWTLSNRNYLPHNLHIHNARFLVRSIGGKRPAPELRGWKDTVYVPPSRDVVIDVEFGTSTDPHHPYMMHCHLLQHEDANMMAQFVVVNPGEDAGPIDTPATRSGGNFAGH